MLRRFTLQNLESRFDYNRYIAVVPKSHKFSDKIMKLILFQGIDLNKLHSRNHFHTIFSSRRIFLNSNSNISEKDQNLKNNIEINKNNSHNSEQNPTRIKSNLSNPNKIQILHKNNLNLSSTNDLLQKTNVSDTKMKERTSNSSNSQLQIQNDNKSKKGNETKRNIPNNNSNQKVSKKIEEITNKSNKTQPNNTKSTRNTSNSTKNIYKKTLATQNNEFVSIKIDKITPKSDIHKNQTNLQNKQSKNNSFTQKKELHQISNEKSQNSTVNQHKNTSKHNNDKISNEKSNVLHISNPNSKKGQINTKQNDSTNLHKENHNNPANNSLKNQNKILLNQNFHKKQITNETTTKTHQSNSIPHQNSSKQTHDSNKNPKPTKTKQTPEITHYKQVKSSNTLQKQTTKSVISNILYSKMSPENGTPIPTVHQTPKQTILQLQTRTPSLKIIPIKTPQGTIKESPIFMSSQTSFLIPKQTPIEIPLKKPVETKHTINETPMQKLIETPKETIKETPVNIPKIVSQQTPVHTIFVSEHEMPHRSPVEAVKQTTIQRPIKTPHATDIPQQTPVPTIYIPRRSPVQTVHELPILIPKQTPIPLYKETPKQITIQTPKQILVQTPKQILVQTPKQILVQTPFETPKQITIQTPKQITNQTPKQITIQTPKQITIQTPKQITNQTPKQTLVQTPFESPKQITIQTPFESPKQITIQTPFETPKQTLVQTPFETPKQTLVQTPIETVKETVSQTPFETPLPTLFETPIYTPMPTPTPQHVIFLQDLPQSVSQTHSLITQNSYTHIINITERYVYFTPQIRDQFSYHFFINENNTYKYVGELQNNHIGFHFGASTGLVFVNHTTLAFQQISYITYKENKRSDYFFVFYPSQFISNRKPIENKEMFRVKSEMVRCNSLLDSYISKFDSSQKIIFEKNRQIFRTSNQDSFQINITESGWKIIFIDRPKTAVYSLNITNATITAFYLSKGSYIPFAQISDGSTNMISIGDRSGVLLIEGTPNTTVTLNTFTITNIFPGSGYFDHICAKQQLPNKQINFFESKINEEIDMKTKLNNLLNIPFDAYSNEMADAPSLYQRDEIERRINPIKQIHATFDENGTYTFIFPPGSYDVFFPNMMNLTIDYFIYKDKTGENLNYLGQIHGVQNHGNLMIRHNFQSFILVQSKEIKSFYFVYINQGLANCQYTYVSNYDADECNIKNDVQNNPNRLRICNLRLIDKQTNYNLFYQSPETAFVYIYSPQNTMTKVLQFSGPLKEETSLPFLEVYSFKKNEYFQSELKITQTSLDEAQRFAFSYESIKKPSIVFPDKITNLEFINNTDFLTFATEHLKNLKQEMPQMQEKNIMFTSSLQTEDPQMISFESENSIPHEVFLDKPHTVVIIPDLYAFKVLCFTRNKDKIHYFGTINSTDHLGVFFGNNSGILHVTSSCNKKFEMYTLNDNSYDDYFFIKKPNSISKRNFDVENNITFKNISLEIESNKRNHNKDLYNNYPFYRVSVCFPKTEFNYRDIYLTPGTTILFPDKKCYSVFYFKEDEKQRIVPIEVQTPENEVYGYHYGLLTHGAIRIKQQCRNSCLEFFIYNSTKSLETFPFSVNDLKFIRSDISDHETEISLNSFYNHINKFNKSYMMKYTMKNRNSTNETENNNRETIIQNNDDNDKKKQQETRIKIIGGGDDSSNDLYINLNQEKEIFPELNKVFEWRSGKKYNFIRNSTVYEGYSYQRIIVVYVFFCLPLSSIIGSFYFANLIYGIFKPSNIENILNNMGENTLGVDENDESQESNTDYNDQYLDDNNLQDLNPT